MSNLKTLKIKSIFEKISKEENHVFVLNEQYKQKTKFKIETEDGVSEVLAMMIKEDQKVDLKTSKGTVKVSSKHIIKTKDGLKYSGELSVGDILFNINGEEPILEVKVGETETVYDLSIQKEDSLYCDSLGFVHHNTWHVTKKLNEILGPDGKGDWVYFKGLKASPLALFTNIYLNRDKLMVFDDSDSVLEDPDSVNMFKGLLDSSKVREASWMSPLATVNTSTMSTHEYNQYILDLDDYIAQNPDKIGKGKGKLPSKIYFTGQVIFISNKNANWFDDAIKSRSLFVDVHLHQQDVLRRIKTIALANAATDGVSADEIDEIMDALTPDTEAPKVDVQYVTPAYTRDGKALTIRAYQVALALKKAKLPNWASLASSYV